jgi:hypothetical protein
LRLAQGLPTVPALRRQAGLHAEMLPVQMVQPQVPRLPRGAVREALLAAVRLQRRAAERTYARNAPGLYDPQ